MGNLSVGVGITKCGKTIHSGMMDIDFNISIN